ncbi:DUF4442 domain-containing protein [Roseivirga thermotolerans]|uniref:DUF4442 domain-containing protein n=1 Tax=Roseivirga thermotolerans TaxID=1758176 RepID=UPI00273F111C|nr:DUF4442 domain-containing protein [Roseivirga thermotolerans]
MYKLKQTLLPMFDTATLMAKAKTSKKHLSLLNFGLARMIPFNKPHGFRIKSLTDFGVDIHIPYKRVNFNHIKGIHACALATASEYSTGLVLLNCLGAKNYRIIMQKLEMDYHYQAKMETTVSFAISQEWLQKEVITPLEKNEAVVVCCEVKAHDKEGNHLTTGRIYWQIKEWSKVKTKV